MGSVLVVGSINLDHRVAVPHVPAPGETVLGGDRELGGGGKGANQAVAAARAGADVRMLGAVGADADGERMLALLDEAGVGREGVASLDGVATGAAYVMVAPSGENSIVVAPGANTALDAEAIASAVSRVAPGSVVLLQLEVPLAVVRAAARAARGAGATVLLNAAPAPAPADLDGLLDDVDLLLVNEGELRAVAGRESGEPADLARVMLARTGTDVVVTLGARGALAVTSAGVLERPARRVEVVDTTAAGDTFAGVLAAGLAGAGAQAVDLAAALDRAGAAASVTVTRAGATDAIPTAAEIDAALASR